MEKYNEKTHWIVKSNSQILGPYSTEEVFELIKKKSIIPIDEITPEYGFWSYVRDVPIFQRPLSQQAKTAGVEVTKTQNVTHTYTDDITSTELLEDTEELSQISDLDRTNPTHFVVSKPQPIRYSNFPKPKVDEFVSSKNKADLKNQKRSLPIFRYIFAISLSIIAMAYYFQDLIKAKTIKFNSSAIIEEALTSLENGDYKNSYLKFQEINQIEAIKSEMKGFHVQFAALVLNQERQTIYARDLLESCSPELKKTPEWLTTMGLSYLIDQNYVEAQKFLSQSINLNPDFLPAWINLGFMYLNQNKYQESWDFFYGAYLRGYAEGHVTSFMSVALIEQWKVNGDRSLLNRGHELLSNFLATSADRRYLNLILKIWLEIKIHSKLTDQLKTDVASFVESDPYLASQFKQNIYEFSYDNKKFEPYCSDISKNLASKDLTSLLFKSVCFFQLGFVGDLTETSVEKAEQLYSKEALMFAVKSVIFNTSDESYQKGLLIGRALSSDSKSKYSLPLILQARFCEQKNDLNCAHKYWSMVYEKNKLEIGAYVGLSRYYKLKNEMTKAKNLITDGLVLAPSYKPLIQMNE